MKKIWINMKEWFGIILGNILLLGLMFGVGYCTGYHDKPEPEKPSSNTPVEKIVLDTIYITKDSIIYKTKYLTQIQHDTIQKIYTLNDSATIQLFYQLVSE